MFVTLKFLKDLLFISSEETSFLEIAFSFSSRILDALAEIIILVISVRSSVLPCPGRGGDFHWTGFVKTPNIFLGLG
jgi:hypothetical protein